ncbi:allantoicase [Nonomuraea diastatica]|uniref:Probable allantoicase n=1 Tax=Nonomuraea diastatica TaxID=1848329 RepID=A0A4V2YEJ8_9ACTN|nr:allantoicase [Nonomuraea diastatica]TDD19496.1 allantoicase [Nonomuraea diastatica]
MSHSDTPPGLNPTSLHLPDLALRTLGGSVVAASDESFAEKESLIRPRRPGFQAETFGNKGQVYDGWETRRRREPGHDWAVVRLGVPGVIRAVVIDTAWFKGNYPPYASVEAAAVDGHPSPDDLPAAPWTEIVPKAGLEGDAEHHFQVADETRYTHVRLNIHPDGGVARLRVHGEARPDLSVYDGLGLDLAALANGGLVTACSNDFYSVPNNVIAPGLARHQAEGWETARRRDEGNDWLVIRLAGRGVVKLAEIDTTNLLFNAPGAVALTGIDGEREVELLPRSRLQPDTPHRFRLRHPGPVTHVRVDIYPDGGLARVRLHGHLS